MPNSNQYNYKDHKVSLLRRFLYSFVFLALGLITIQYFVVQDFEDSYADLTQRSFKFKDQIVTNHLQQMVVDVNYLSTKNYAFSAKSNISLLSQERIKEIIESSPSYYQIRLLNTDGQELIRYQRKKDGSIEENQNLQNKKQRYYVQEALKLNVGELYLSVVDLNIENGKIERPFLPMVRCAAKLTKEKNGFDGIIVINYMIRNAINTIDKLRDKNHQLLIIDRNGYFIKHPNPEYEFGFMFKDSIDKKFELSKTDKWKDIIDTPFYYGAFNNEFYISCRLDLNTNLNNYLAEKGITNANVLGNSALYFVRKLDKDQYSSLKWKSKKWFILIGVLLSILLGIRVWIAQKALNEKEQLIKKLKSVNYNLSKNKNQIAKLSKNLKRRNDQLTNFNHILVHNFRSPIVSLGNLVEYIGRSDDEDEKNKMLATVKTVLGSLNTLIDDVYQTSRIMDAKDIQKSEINILEVINKSLELYADDLQNMNATVSTDLEWEYVTFNKLYLESIIQNLISNAIKYADSKRRLKLEFISTKTLNGGILYVKDNGIGIDLDKHKNSVFKLYTRFDRKNSGKGMGLFMVKAQIESLGGRIYLESKPDVGTTFILHFNNN